MSTTRNLRPLGDPPSPARPWSRPSPAHDAARPSGGAPGTPVLRLVERRPLRVADVALFYGERSGGIRTYLDAKVEHAQRTGAFEHHLIVPGAARASEPDLDAALQFAAEHQWEPVFRAELADLERLAGAR